MSHRGLVLCASGAAWNMLETEIRAVFAAYREKRDLPVSKASEPKP